MKNVFNLTLLAVIFVLSLWELLGIYNARQKKLTTNVSRLLTHTLLLVFSVIALIQIFFWEEKLSHLSSLALKGPFVIVCLFLIVLSANEFLGSLRAKLKGFTKNISRIITHLIICVFSLILFLRIV